MRQILDELYTDRPDGLAGNEDCGQMSAWYVLSALGFYPVTPGSDVYVIGTPLFPRVTLDLDGGASFVIEAPEVSAERRYVQGLTLNGEAREQALLRHAEIVAGGVLRFEMGATPNPDWGAIELGEPLRAEGFVLAPEVSPSEPSFDASVTLSLQVRGADRDGVELRYTLDGSEPGPASARYDGPITLEDSATLQAIALREGSRSAVLRAEFHRRAHTWPVTLTHAHNPGYHADGPQGLVDGLRGTKNWRTGAWQGYQGTDFEAVVDLEALRSIQTLASGYLQDARSWIWMPVEVEYAVSRDGEAYEVVGTVGHAIPDDDVDAVYLHDFRLELPKPTRARYVRVRARSYGTIPAWHPGRGDQAFIFVDEIEIE